MLDNVVLAMITIIAALSFTLDEVWLSYFGLFVIILYFIIYPFMSARLKVYRHNKYIDKANKHLKLKLLAMDMGGTYEACYYFLEESKLEFVVLPGSPGLTITKEKALEKMKYFESFRDHQGRREIYFAELARLELDS